MCILHKMVTASTTLLSGMNFQFQAVKLVKTGRWGRKEKSWLACDFPPPLRQDETEASHCMQRTEVCASKLCLPAVQQHNEEGLGSRTHGDFPEFYSLFLISFPVLLITPFQLLCGDTDRQQVLFNQTRSSFKKLYITKFLSGWKEKKKSSQGVSYFYTPRENLVKTQV